MEISESVRDDLESRTNVVGTAVGRKRVGGRETDEECVIVLVRRKIPETQLVSGDLVPKTVDLDGETVKTDVQEVGDVRTQATVQPVELAKPSRKRRWRPAPAGVSAGHLEVTAGTLGSSPLHTSDGETVVLTNAHVAAPIGAAQAGDAFLQPGPADGGSEDDQLGTLREWSEIVRDEPNETDSALVAVDEADLREDVLGVGPLQGWAAVDRDAEYTKSGRTTGVTTGRLRARDARIKVGGYYEEPVTFTGVDVFDPMSAGGDSGSLIGIERADGLHGTHLLFAGSDRATIAIPVETVQEEHGELTPVAAPDEHVPFRRRVERHLRTRHGEAVRADDRVDFRVDAWPVTLVVVVTETAEEALAAIGPALAAAGDDELPVVILPAGERTDELARIRRVSVVGVDV